MYHYNTYGCLPKLFIAIRISDATELALCKSFLLGSDCSKSTLLLSAGLRRENMNISFDCLMD